MRKKRIILKFNNKIEVKNTFTKVKEFLIKDSLPKYEWKLEGESKQIGTYTCFKATAIVKVNESDFRNFRFKNKDKKEEEAKAETAKDTTKAKKTNFTDDWEMPKENTITAWYCPEIPINQGPENYCLKKVLAGRKMKILTIFKKH